MEIMACGDHGLWSVWGWFALLQLCPKIPASGRNMPLALPFTRRTLH